MARKQSNPNVERVYKQFLIDVSAHEDVPQETKEKLRLLIESGNKIDLQSIEKIVSE